MTEPAAMPRPKVIDDVSDAYSRRGKSVVLLTGNTHDQFYSKKTGDFVDLPFALYHYLSDVFTVLRMDISIGLSAYNEDDLKALNQLVKQADSVAIYDQEKVGDIQAKMASTK